MTRTVLSRGPLALAASALIVSAVATAQAQTTVITTQPAPTTGTVVRTTEPLELTPVQRQTIYRTVTRERVAVAPGGAVEYRVGTRVPESATLYAMPQTVEVPAVQAYKYMVVNGRVLLVDPATSQVVAEVAE